jgi:photosystem II PsbU protein
MKRLVRWFSVLSLVLTSFFGLNAQQALAVDANFSLHLSSPTLVAMETGELRNKVSDKMATEYGKKIDLNNTNMRAFRTMAGMYPTLATLLIKNAPYDSVDDMLKLDGLTEKQLETLRINFDKFTVSAPEEALVEGADRINNGIYR